MDVFSRPAFGASMERRSGPWQISALLEDSPAWHFIICPALVWITLQKSWAFLNNTYGARGGEGKLTNGCRVMLCHGSAAGPCAFGFGISGLSYKFNGSVEAEYGPAV